MRFNGLVFGILLSLSAIGQPLNVIHSNTSSIQNYLPKQYKGNPQIFSAIQDDHGVMYFANQLGVIRYDGVTWEVIETGGSEVYHLSLSDNGRIYVLCKGDFGILVPDSKGALKFQSELDLFSDVIEKEEFNTFSKILFQGDLIYVIVNDQLYLIRDGKVETVPETENCTFIEQANNQVYFQLKGGPLYTLQGNRTIPVLDGDKFVDKEVVSALKFNGGLYIVTRKGELYIKNKSESPELKKQFGSYSVSSVSNNRDLNLIVGTTEGILILNRELEVVKKIGVPEGLTDATIKSQYIDAENNLWIGSQIGISKIEIDTPIEIFNKSNSLNGSIEAVSWYNNTIFCATQNGVYYLDQEGNAIKIPKLESDCYGLHVANNERDSVLLVAEVNGVYQIDARYNVKKISDGGPYSFYSSPLSKDEIFVVHYDGLSNLVYKNGNWVEENYIRSFTKGEPFNFLIKENGEIWMGTLNDGVYQTTTNDFADLSSYHHYDTSNGLPHGQSYLFEYDEEIYAGTDKGLYRYEEGVFSFTDKFKLGSNKGMTGVHRVSLDAKGRIWAMLFDEKNNYEIGYSTHKQGEYFWSNEDFLKYTEDLIHGIFHDFTGMTWLGGPNGLIKYNPNFNKKELPEYKCLISSVLLGDSILTGGILADPSKEKGGTVKLSYTGNTPLTIQYSASTYIDESKTKYSFYLEGFDEKWSDWNKRNFKEYNLKEGTYTFYVKAKNILGKESRDSSFSFVISPPWYRTGWAISGYVISVVLLVYGLIKLSLQRVKQQNKKLESIVALRTQEVLEQKKQAEKQRDIIGEKNQEIMDSINYAKRIQSAILPSDEMFEKSFKESFVLYKPKDIVAGDFYWLQHIDGKVIVAAADCTGHGVPGAMVSVVCNNALNRSVREYGLTDPGEILDQVRELVIEEFEKSDQEVKDGMDIALCVIDGSTLRYAGANNPLWIIRNEEIIETKANKQPIGKFDNLQSFTTHTFHLQKKDSVYIFSDGYVDQFGGEKGKKFKASSLRSLLLSIQNSSMDEQQVVLDKTFEEWKGDLEQIDDVCVIGFRG